MVNEDVPFYCPHCNFLSKDKDVMIIHRYDHPRHGDDFLNKGTSTITKPKILPYYCNKCEFFTEDIAIIKKHKSTNHRSCIKVGGEKLDNGINENDETINSARKKLGTHHNNASQAINNILKEADIKIIVSNTLWNTPKSPNKEVTKSEIFPILQNTEKRHIVYKTIKPKKQKEKSFACSQCNKRFLKSFRLRQHIKHHKGAYKCSECNKVFILQSNLNKHKHKTGMHTKKNFLCHLCNTSFLFEYSLKIHLRSHSGEKPFHCSKCEKSFGAKGYLNSHVKMVHSEHRPYPCSLCEKSFKTKSDMKKHVFLHTGEKPYLCIVCLGSFAAKHNLLEHKQTHKVGSMCL